MMPADGVCRGGRVLVGTMEPETGSNPKPRRSPSMRHAPVWMEKSAGEREKKRGKEREQPARYAPGTGAALHHGMVGEHDGGA